MSSLTGNQQFVFVDGSTGVHSFASGASNIGTLAPSTPLRIVASISTLTQGNTLSQVTGVTDSEGFTWHKAGQVNQSGINQPGGLTGAPLTENLEIWYTDNFVSTAMSSPTTYQITAAVDNDVDSIAIYYGCQKNLDASNPIDANASFPASATVMSSSSSTASVSSIASDTADLHVVVAYSAVGPGQRPGSGGDPSVAGVTSSDYGVGDSFHLNQNYHINGVAVYDRTSALAAATIHTHDATNNQIMLAVAFTQDASTVSGTLATTEDADVFSAHGGYLGTMAATETPDNLFMYGFTTDVGTFTATEDTDTWATAQGFEALAIEHQQTVNSGSVSFTTDGPNRIVVMAFGTSSVGTEALQPVQSITSTSGLVFKREKAFLGGQDTASQDNFLSEIWWAHAPHKLTSDNITITYESGLSSTLFSSIFAIKGLNGNFNDPFDRINPFAYGSAAGSMVSGTSPPQAARHVATGPLSSSGGASDFATFDPTVTHNALLESGDLTVTSIGTNDPNNWAGPDIAAGKDQSSGLIYIEATFDHIAGANYGFGVLHVASDWDVAGLIASGIGGIYLRGDGTIWAAGSQVGTLGVTPADGDVIGLLINPQWALAWFKDVTQNSYWNNDPAAVPGLASDSSHHGGLLMSTFEIVEDPSGGFTGQLLGGLILPYASPGGIAGSPAASVTMNFGASAFVGDPPGNASGWTFTQPAITPTRVHYPSVVVGVQFNVTDGGPGSALAAPPGYTNLTYYDGQGSQRHGNLDVYAQVRTDNILTTDNDFMVAPNAVKQWTLLYTTFAGGAAPNLWASSEDPDRMVFVGHQSPGVRGDLTASETADIFAAFGYPADTGLLIGFETPDHFSAYGFQPLTGTFNTTETTDRFNAAGIGRGEDGVFITTEATDVFAAIGFTPASGTWVSTEAADRMRFIGAGVTQVRRRRRRFVT